MSEWRLIETADKQPGKEILGIISYGGKVIREPFISFWSPTLQKFYCDPTHWMPWAPPASGLQP